MADDNNSKTMALLSMILGIVGMVVFCVGNLAGVGIIGTVLSLVGLILGIVARNANNKLAVPDSATGTQAMVGIIVSGITLGIQVLAIIALIVLILIYGVGIFAIILSEM